MIKTWDSLHLCQGELFNARSFVIDEPHTPVLEECYDALRPLVPTAETYHWLINGGYIEDSDDPNDENSIFSIAYFEIEVTILTTRSSMIQEFHTRSLNRSGSVDKYDQRVGTYCGF